MKEQGAGTRVGWQWWTPPSKTKPAENHFSPSPGWYHFTTGFHYKQSMDEGKTKVWEHDETATRGWQICRRSHRMKMTSAVQMTFLHRHCRLSPWPGIQTIWTTSLHYILVINPRGCSWAPPSLVGQLQGEGTPCFCPGVGRRHRAALRCGAPAIRQPGRWKAADWWCGSRNVTWGAGCRPPRDAGGQLLWQRRMSSTL